jgi:hypothetical protein
MALFGGYGGWVEGYSYQQTNVGSSSLSSALYDGYRCRNDAWETYDGHHWHYLGKSNQVTERAWTGMIVKKDQFPDPRVDFQSNFTRPPKIYLFGGGYAGFSTENERRVNSVLGRPDAYWSYDAVNWTQINYQEGGGSTGFTFYSSQEWTRTVVDTVTNYLGVWGHSVTQFNTTTGASVSNIILKSFQMINFF